MKGLICISLGVLAFGGCGPIPDTGQQASRQRSAGADRHNADPVFPTCGITDTTHLTDSGIGYLQIGTPVARIARNCTIHSDTVEMDAEAMPQRVLVVAASGETLRVLTDHEDRVWRIEIETPRFRTADGLGVRSTLADLLAHEGVNGIEGDGLLYVTASGHCGISFRIDYVPEPNLVRPKLSRAELERLPPRLAVDRVLVVGC